MLESEMNQPIIVNFLPWLTVYQEITIGKVTFWNYQRESDRRVTDPSIKTRLDRHFESYRTLNGSTVPITVCAFDGKTFYDEFNNEESIYLLRAVSALAFSSSIPVIAKWIQDPSSHESPPSMNAFSILSRKLWRDSDRYGHVSPSLMDLGLQDGHIVFQKPIAARSDAWVST